MSDGMSGQQRNSDDDEFYRAVREMAEGTTSVRGRRAKRARKRAWTSAGVVLVLAVVGTFAWLQLRHPSTVSAGPSIAPTIADAALPTIADAKPPVLPFAGTPAQAWADGAAGIVVPAAKPVGSFTAAQVEAAYQTSRKLLVAGNLNKVTLLGGQPTAFANLLNSQERAQFLGSLNTKGVSKDGSPLSTRVEVTSFAPGSAELVGNVIKVRGTMSAKSAAFAGTTVLAISVNYLFAYAVESPGSPADWTRVVAHQYGSFDFAQWSDPGGPLQPWDDTGGDHAGALCGSTDGYLRPDYPSESASAPGPTPSGPFMNPYSNASAGGSAACAQTTHV
ncbi:MAG TPA: hypothetical protein VIL16_08020 [Trebonia sp.]